MMRNTTKLVLWTSLFLALAVVSAPPVTAAEASPFGVNIHAPGGNELKLVLDRAKVAGIGWVRIDFVWAFVESSRDAYDWGLYDEIAAAAQARGIEVYATLAYTPGWATSGPEWVGVPDPAEWAEFCELAAKRYRGKIRHWGLWNEPNLDKFWGGSRQQYIDVILKPGADAIHRAAPEALVGGPDLAHLTADDSDWYRWLREVIIEAGGQLDFITHHVYDLDGAGDVGKKLDDSTPFGSSPALWDAANPSVEEVLKNAGWSGRPVWLTEVGWESARVGESRQSTHYQGVLNDWLSGRPDRNWIQKVFFYEMKDGGSDPTWGILRADGSAKPAYDAYRSFIQARQPEETENDAAVVSSTFPVTMEAGQQLPVELTFRNTGATTWTRAAGYQLGADGDSDPFTTARQPLANADRIAPDQQKTFSFNLTAPNTPGTYTVRWRMLREGEDRFGATFTRQIQVTAAPPAGQRALRLLDNGFRVEVSWRDPGSGRAGYGRAIPDSAQTGFFWFFDQSNFELVVKVLDGRPLNGSYWVFYGALSDVEYWITVTETRTGRVKRYHNAPGNLCGRGDTSAFPTGRTASDSAPLFSPEASVLQAMELPVLPAELPEPLSPATAAAGSCVANASNLCLFDNRFQVAVDWRTQAGSTGKGTAIPASSESGTFWFFGPENVELVVKVLDGRPLNGKFWFFYGALSDVQYTITVTDTVTGTVKRYRNAQGNLCGKGDTSAF
jgi:hypothetical protein